MAVCESPRDVDNIGMGEGGTGLLLLHKVGEELHAGCHVWHRNEETLGEAAECGIVQFLWAIGRSQHQDLLVARTDLQPGVWDLIFGLMITSIDTITFIPQRRYSWN